MEKVVKAVKRYFAKPGAERGKEQERQVLIFVGRIGRPMVLGFLIIAIWLVASPTLTDTFNSPLSSITLGSLVIAIVGLPILIFIEYKLIRWLFSGSNEETYRTIWGPLVVSMLVIGTIVWNTLFKH